MDIISLYYFQELAKDLHFTRTAQRLFISQQALSKSIHNLEEYYGVPLLTRKPGIRLTAAGEEVLKFAESVTSQSTDLNHVLSDIKGEDKGVIHFGASKVRTNIYLPHIIKPFYARYPRVQIRITDAISSKLEPLVLSGALDLALVINNDTHPSIKGKPIFKDSFYLCVTDSLLSEYYPDEAERNLLVRKSALNADIRDFAKIPFSVCQNRAGELINEAIREAGLELNIILSSTYSKIALDMCLKGITATFVNRAILTNEQEYFPDDLHVFPLEFEDANLVYNTYLIHLKDRYFPRYLTYFIELLTDYSLSIDHMSIEEITKGRH